MKYPKSLTLEPLFKSYKLDMVTCVYSLGYLGG